MQDSKPDICSSCTTPSLNSTIPASAASNNADTVMPEDCWKSNVVLPFIINSIISRCLRIGSTLPQHQVLCNSNCKFHLSVAFPLLSQRLQCFAMDGEKVHIPTQNKNDDLVSVDWDLRLVRYFHDMWRVEIVLIWILFIGLSIHLVHGKKFLFENFCPNLANTEQQQPPQQQNSHTHAHSHSPRYFVMGARDSANYGLGNLLAFYPACFFYSMLTARFLAIDDRSHLGKFCTILHCGFPLYSSIKVAYPELFSTLDERQMKTLHHQNFPQSFDNDHYYNDTLLTAVGMDDRSSWWVWNPITRQCIANITGCQQGDIGCAERVAFQRLLLGPFLHLERVIPWTEESVEGLSRGMKQAILTLPREYVPRLDMAVHLRNQFRYFEHEMDITHPEAKAEVAQWLNSTECHEVFDHLANEVLRRYQESTTSSPRHQQQNHHHHHNHHNQDFLLFITADSEEVKFAFQRFLQKKLPSRSSLRTVTIRTGGTYHVKGTERFSTDGQNKSLFFLVLEWYLLTLCDITLAWRMGGTRGTSTFVGSARKVAGTHERSNREDGRSIASRSFQLVRGKNGYVFEEFWTYGVLDSV